MPTPVTAIGEQTTLAHRKRRAGQRLLLSLAEPELNADQRALLRQLTPAGFALDPGGASEPAQLRELAAELAARLSPSVPPILAARHAVGRPCHGCSEQPPMAWLVRADDPQLTGAVGRAWRQELAALGFHLHLAPSCELEALAGEPVPGLGAEPGAQLVGPDAQRAARTLSAFVRDDERAACAACPSLCQGWLAEGRLVSHEKELPGLLAEELAPVDAAVRMGVPALLVGWGRWPAFDEDRPAWCVPALLEGQLRGRLGFRGLLLAEDPDLAAGAEGLQRHRLLRAGLEAGLDLWVLGPGCERQLEIFEALVKLQERRPGLDLAIDESQKRLLRGRERLMLHRPRPGSEVLDSPAHRELVLLARARGG